MLNYLHNIDWPIVASALAIVAAIAVLWGRL